MARRPPGIGSAVVLLLVFAVLQGVVTNAISSIASALGLEPELACHGPCREPELRRVEPDVGQRHLVLQPPFG